MGRIPQGSSPAARRPVMRIDTERRTRTHVRQLEALGYTVTLTAAA